MMKEILKRGIVGVFFGAFATIVIMGIIVYFSELKSIDASIFFKNSIAAMICSGFISVAPLIFEMRSLKLYQQTLIHFIGIGIVYYIIALTTGWISFTLSAILSSLIVFVVFYIISWCCFYLYFKHEAKKMTKKLQNC